MLRWFKKKLPSSEEIKNHSSLKPIHGLLHSKYLWHLDVDTVSRAVAIGLFVAVLPIPLQMLWVTLLAIWVRANLPISIFITWINNPFTFIPINIFIYKVGSWVTGETVKSFNFPSFQWGIKKIKIFVHKFLIWSASFGKPYLIGLAIVSILSAVLGYFSVRIVYKLMNKKNHT